MTWWHNASKGQRLAQIDGGIELGMTAKQIALASGVVVTKRVVDYANKNARYFGRAPGWSQHRRASSQRLRLDYFSAASFEGASL